MRRMYSQKQIESLAKQVADYEIESGISLIRAFDLLGTLKYVYGVDENENLVKQTPDEMMDSTYGGDDNVNKILVVDDDGYVSPASSFAETMTGYSASFPSATNLTKEIVYAGVVKNGNKLTIACYGKLTRTDTITGNIDLIRLVVPQEVFDKLIPTPFAGINNGLGYIKVYLASNYNAGVELPALILKESNRTVTVRLYKFNDNMVANTEYLARFEATFLLSDNLAE